MNEAKLYQQFKTKVKKAIPNSFWYKLPDTFKYGGKKPFDGMLVMSGIAFAIEFKSKGEKATPYQKVMLKMFENAGGISLLFEEGNKTMDEFIEFIIAARDHYRHMGEVIEKATDDNPFEY